MTAIEFMKCMVSSLERNGCYIRQTITPPAFQSDLEIEDTFDSDFSVSSTSRRIDTDIMDVYSVAIFTFSDIPSIGFALMMSNWTFIDIATALIEMGYYKLFTKTIVSIKLYGYTSVQNILNDIVFSNNGAALDKLLEVDYYEEYKDTEYIKNRLVDKRMLEISEEMIDRMITKFPDSTNCIPILLRYKHDKFDSTKEEIGL